MGETYSLVPTDFSEWRRVWFEGEWWFAIPDVIKDWAETRDANRYWRQMKSRADEELAHFIKEHVRKFPLVAGDGRMHNIDAATEESLLRLVQSIPSKNAEKIKRALAHLGKQKIDEIRQGPSPTDIARAKYRRQGYPDDWIEVRIAELLARNDLTEVWKERGAEEDHYALLTNILTEGTFGLTVKSYKVYKAISQNTNLQDNMTPEELALSVLSKATAQRFHEGRDSQGVSELRRDVTEAGDVTGKAREIIELATGQSIVSPKNARDLKQFPDKKGRKQLLGPQQQNLL